jgi:hypothetical protein
MARNWRYAFTVSALSLLASACDTAEPGGGFTNGPSPAVLRAEDKAGVRDDLRQPEGAAAAGAETDKASSGVSDKPAPAKTPEAGSAKDSAKAPSAPK